MNRTYAADPCPHWTWTGTHYQHRDATTPARLGPGTIRFLPPLPAQHAHCDSCGKSWRRHQSRWENDEETTP